MLSLFKGEFLFHPAALDYSGNTCSNNCAYCFANIRANERRFNIAKLSKLCIGKTDNKTLVDWFFYHGYPVCVSNRSDPFATTNLDNTTAVLDLMNTVENGLYIQTKGMSKGWKISDLDAVKKSNVVVYITIDTMRDDVCKRIEPGAPLPGDRLELARYAKARGWFVTVGVNPCWKPWMPEDDFDRLMAELDKIGVDCVFMQPLHIPRRSWDEMPPAKKARFAGDEKGPHEYPFDLYKRYMEDGTLWRAWKDRLTVNEDPYPSKAFTRQRKALGKGLPSWLDYQVHADAKAAAGDPVLTFADYSDALLAECGDLASYTSATFNSYISAMEMMLWKNSALCKNAKSYVDLLRCWWKYDNLWLSPKRNPFIKPIVGEDGKPVEDYFGNPVYYYLRHDEEAYDMRLAKIPVSYLERKGVKKTW